MILTCGEIENIRKGRDACFLVISFFGVTVAAPQAFIRQWVPQAFELPSERRNHLPSARPVT